MRCPDCNKFVSYDEPQCEVASVSLDGESVSASVTVQLNCQDCGTTLKDAEIEAQAEFQHECTAPRAKDWKANQEQFEIENDGDAEGTSRTQNTDRHGKPIRLSRYMKTFYGFTLEPEIKC